MYVRWMGAFHKNTSLEESISFEMERTSVAACEHLQKKNQSYVWARVGLIIAKEGIIRRFDHDVWSLPDANNPGSLIKTRDHAWHSYHHEAWCKPGFVMGIVTKIGWWTLRPKTRHSIENAAKKYNLPVYFLSSKGVLKEVVL